jgi:hypothetical protein
MRTPKNNTYLHYHCSVTNGQVLWRRILFCSLSKGSGSAAKVYFTVLWWMVKFCGKQQGSVTKGQLQCSVVKGQVPWWRVQVNLTVLWRRVGFCCRLSGYVARDQVLRVRFCGDISFTAAHFLSQLFVTFLHCCPLSFTSFTFLNILSHISLFVTFIHFCSPGDFSFTSCCFMHVSWVPLAHLQLTIGLTSDCHFHLLLFNFSSLLSLCHFHSLWFTFFHQWTIFGAVWSSRSLHSGASAKHHTMMCGDFPSRTLNKSVLSSQSPFSFTFVHLCSRFALLFTFFHQRTNVGEVWSSSSLQAGASAKHQLGTVIWGEFPTIISCKHTVCDFQLFFHFQVNQVTTIEIWWTKVTNV